MLPVGAEAVVSVTWLGGGEIWFAGDEGSQRESPAGARSSQRNQGPAEARSSQEEPRRS